MSKFVDDTIEFKDLERVDFLTHGFHGSLHFYLKNNGYHLLTNANGSTLYRFYTDLNQALEEFRENEGINNQF